MHFERGIIWWLFQKLALDAQKLFEDLFAYMAQWEEARAASRGRSEGADEPEAAGN